MHFLNKLFCLFGLAVAGVNAQEPQDKIRAVAAMDKITAVMDKALEVELSSIKKQLSKGNLAVGRIVQQKLKGISVKFAHAFKNDLTQDERSFLTDFLRDLKKISATTTADLMIMAQVTDTYECRDALNKAVEKFFPEFNEKLASIENKKEPIALMRQLEKVDLHDASFNAVTKFMCQCAYLEQYFSDEHLDISAQEFVDTSVIKGCIAHLSQTIVLPFVVFNDFYFFPGWEDKFKEVGDTFAIVHVVCEKLLYSIDQL